MKVLKPILLFVAIAATGLLLQACPPGKSPTPIAHIKPAGLDAVMADSSIQLLDVRTPDEFAEGHIVSAVNVNVNDSTFLATVGSLISKDRPVYIYCRSGKRSMTAARILADEGYTTINIDGGILAWQGASLPTQKME